MKRYWYLLLVGVGLLILICAYVFGMGYGIAERLIVQRYQILPRVNEPALVEIESVRVIVGPDGVAGELKEFGLKYVFVSNLYFADWWSWGVVNKHHWLVFRYFLDKQDHWLVIPMSGQIGWSEEVGKSSISLTTDEIVSKLTRGDKVGLALTYRFNDNLDPKTVRAWLIERQIEYQKKDRRTVVKEVGSFPGKAYTDSQVQELLKSNTQTIVLNRSDFRLSTMWRR